MTDLIENKARQLEHDAKNLEDEDENLVQAPPSSKDIATSKGSTKKPANFSDDKNEKAGPGKYFSDKFLKGIFRNKNTYYKYSDQNLMTPFF